MNADREDFGHRHASDAPRDASGALVTRLDIAPLRSGPLDGTTFTVKDNIDLAGLKTSYGSPAWARTHPAPRHNALCVDLLLAAGARCVGKAIADEFTYSLEGENRFYGTPRNAKAPDRIPGGSSSGSAASVANGIADFSLGTDSGGSIRVPASFCGLWGLRPSLHRISEAGVLPFMPSVSTVGILARSRPLLDSVTHVLLRTAPTPPTPLRHLLILNDAMALADAAVARAAEAALCAIATRTGITPARVDFAAIAGAAASLRMCNEKALRDLQTLEFQSTLGSWIETHQDDLSPAFTRAYGNVRHFDRVAALGSLDRCARLSEKINAALPPGTVVCFPTTPTIAPLKGTLDSPEAALDFYDRTMAITALAGVGGLPEMSLPLLSVDGCPAGLSVAAGHGEDVFLLDAVATMMGEVPRPPLALPSYQM